MGNPETDYSYSRSDKLAIALACLAGVMAIILFLVEKTPLVVTGLIIAMIALAIYPILHFFKSKPARIGLIIFAIIGGLFFACAEWPKSLGSASVRVKYSSTQTVEFSTLPGDYNELVNLDNIATLIRTGDANRESVEMSELASPSATVEEPKPGEKYPADGGPGIEFPNAGKPGIYIGPVTTFGTKGNKYRFSLSSPTNIVPVGARRFRLTLRSVEDKSKEKEKHILIRYVFGISEE